MAGARAPAVFFGLGLRAARAESSIPSARQPDHGGLRLLHESAVANHRSVVAPQEFAVVAPGRIVASSLLQPSCPSW